jgi:hypothetical protein
MKKISILLTVLFLFSCGKKESAINWKANTPFAEVLESAGEKYVMIDFIKDG